MVTDFARTPIVYLYYTKSFLTALTYTLFGVTKFMIRYELSAIKDTKVTRK